MENFAFERLDVYNKALSLVKDVYILCERFPSHERFELTAQLHRAIISVPSNIAESSGRNSYKEKIHFLEYGYGSLMEAFSQLKTAVILGYITDLDVEFARPKFAEVSNKLNALVKSYRDKLK